LDTDTFFKTTGDAFGAATSRWRDGLGRRAGLAIMPSRTRIAVTTPTMVPAVERRPRQKRERGRAFFREGASGVLPARSARYALTFSSGSITCT